MPLARAERAHSANRRRLVAILALAIAGLLHQHIAEGASTPRIFALGDQGKSGGVLEATADSLRSRLEVAQREGAAATLLYLGDNFYPIGLNGNQGVIRDVLEVSGLRAIHANLGRAQVHAVAGNHDYYARRILWKSTGFSTEGNERAAQLDDWTYHFRESEVIRLGSETALATLIFFDSAIALAGTGAQVEAAFSSLEDALRDPATRLATWRILAMHHPLFTRGKHGPKASGFDACLAETSANDQDLCNARYQVFAARLKSVMLASGVCIQLVLAGHDHSLQFLYSEGESGAALACPSAYVISGAASKLSKTRALGRDEFAAHRGDPPSDKGSAGFAEVDITTTDLRIRFIGSGGRVLCLVDGAGNSADEFGITSDGIKVPWRTCAGP